MTRRRSLVLTTLVTTVASLFLALPALATEGEEATASGFGSGDWDGVVLAVVVGLVFAIGMFMDADPGGIPRADDHH